ncbi:MAG: tetratricopeptide repeat protein [Candidatus Aureabacteria bacterium]|nr:tetratricopeptide repeat protein [Candidatus Auribacterota bacterium]
MAFRHFIFIFFPLMIFTICFAASADVIRVEGGAVLKGDISYADNEMIEIKMPSGVVAIKKDKIISIKPAALEDIESLLTDAEVETRPEVALEMCGEASKKLDDFKRTYPVYTSDITKWVEKLNLKGRSIIAQIKERVKSENLVLYEGKYVSKDLRDLIVGEEQEREQKKERRQSAIGYFDEANTLVSQKKYDQAIEKYRKAVEEMPDAIGPHYNLAKIYDVKQDYRNAIKEYEKVVEIEPSILDAYVAMGEIYRKMNYVGQGIEVLKKAIEINPNLIESRYNLAMFYFNIKDYNNAILQCHEIVEQDPGFTPASILLGTIYFNKKAYDKAAEAYEMVLQKDPDSEEVHHLLGTLYRAQKKYSAAIKEYKKVLDINPNNKEAKESIEEIKVLEKITNIAED